jgi:hypothetical protein
MKKGSHKKKHNQIDEYSMPTEPLPDFPAMFFPPSDYSGPGEGRIHAPFTPYQDPQRPLPVYPYIQNPSPDVDRYPSLSATPPSTNYGVSHAENIRTHLTRRKRFIPACIGLFFFCVQSLLIVRFGVIFLNLSPTVTWVSIVSVVSAIFVLPFQVIWSQIPVVGSLVPTNIEVYTLVAILIYGVLSRLLVGIIKVLLKSH